LHQQRIGLLGAVLHRQPFAVFELRDGQMEGNRELLEETGPALEQALRLVVVSPSCGEVCAEARLVRAQELRSQTGRQLLDDGEKLVALSFRIM
jgi:hypothetical protein